MTESPQVTKNRTKDAVSTDTLMTRCYDHIDYWNSTPYRTRKEISSDSAKVFGMYKTKDKKIKPVDEADGVRAAPGSKVDCNTSFRALPTYREAPESHPNA
ncbi:uncharacterized protein L3040_001141 [Drepanopeziza brunnea f. sp. 'multigermtubi']|uniref:uncharacterized protein n=1 Tax=Drepanopeziza brunnea f. sp. 'multigermtubi' TaxID=698441 RepID=UPI0023A2C5D4|nr:hypothetical protein L3040_001141 [Drepanopeziza brunnea f. sp. 'multigermtubi']